MHARRILFVEDDDDDVFLIKRACRNLGLDRLDFASNGKLAAEFLRSLMATAGTFEIPLIFLDLNMPEMNGFEFLRWLRGEGPLRAVPVVIFSTSENPRDIESAYALGANAYMVKSSDTSELSKMISAADAFWRGYNRVR